MPVPIAVPYGFKGEGGDPAFAAKGLSRRRLIQAAGLGGAVVLAGAWLYRLVGGTRPPGAGRICLSDDEMRVAEAAADAFFPGPPESPLAAREVRVAELADAYIGGLYPDNQRLFKALFGALEVWTLPTTGSRFSRLSLADRRAALDAWRDSRLLARRAGHQSLRFLFSMLFFEDPRVRAACGFHFGCDLGERAL